MTPKIDADWIEYFRNNGFPSAMGVAVGMEGAVYSLLPRALVAKVWYRRGEAELRLLKEFYDTLKTSSGSIATPEILEIRLINGTLVSFERFLPGVPLQHHLSENALHADETAVRTTAKVLSFLRTIHPQYPLRNLPVLDEAASPWRSAIKWSEAIQAVVTRRIGRFGQQLADEITDLDHVVASVNAFLPTRDDSQMGLIHGDLCGVNIMVDDALQPTAVFDFGFLSTVGDPAFDASVSSAIFNMYGPNARSIDEEVTNIFELALGYPRKVLLAYRAVYCLLTSNAYSADGTDGHFRWCVSMLKREDVRMALDL